jgi:hypothetical protein
MSYGGPTQWVSSRTWIRIFNAFASQNLPYPKASSSSTAQAKPAMQAMGMSQTTRRYLLVGGEQTGVGTWVLSPSYELDYPIGSDDEPGTGDYSIVLRGAGGAELFVRRFALSPGHIDTLDNSGLVAPLSFVELLPLPDGVTTMELRQAETLLATTPRSPSAPTVQILSPTSAGFEGQPNAPRIRWTGEDGDSNPLHYMVRYRPNEGAEWQTLATDWTFTELAVNLADLPGGSAARVEVLASDGFNTGVATSPTFIVQGKPPQVQILMPQDGTASEQGERLILRGTGSDLEGELEDGAFIWTSDRDGVLGTGRWIETTALSTGSHTITLTATDRDGQTGTDSVTVNVTARINTQPVADAGPDVTSAGGCGVPLDGSRSQDPDGDALTYLWAVVTTPPGRQAWLSNAESRTTRLFTDGPGDYEVELVVHDGQVASQPDRITVHVSGQAADKMCFYLYLPILPNRQAETTNSTFMPLIVR